MEMDLLIVAYALLAIGVFAGYKILNWIAKKIDSRPLWKGKDKENIQASLLKLQKANNLENLKGIYEEEIKIHPKYRRFLKVAFNERASQIDSSLLSQSPLNLKEKKVRKIWLIALAGTCVTFLVNSTLSLFALEQIQPVIKEFIVALLLTYFVFSTWIIYRSAYQRKETGWLSLVILQVPISLLLSARSQVDTSAWEAYLNLQMKNLDWILSGISLAILLFYWIGCVSLRKINYQLKIRERLASLKEARLPS